MVVAPTPPSSPILTPRQEKREAPSDDSSTATSTEATSLEQRVVELELKLATLSRLLQQQQRQQLAPALTPRPISPIFMNNERNFTPHLESPCPSRRHSSRNLLRDFAEDKDVVMPDMMDSTTSLPRIDHAVMEVPPPPPPPLEQPPKSIQQKWSDYLNTFQESHHDVDRQMQEFIRVPSHLEYLLCYGFYICVDCFLYILTILPIRFCWSCILLISYGRTKLFPSTQTRFHRRHLYQLIQVFIIFTVYHYILMPISIGKLYHWIRGQAMLKLYVLIAIVEVFDRLMCSLGQDCLDSMYWNTTRNPRSARFFISVAVVLVYAAVHATILFVHVATLNVAMNSADQALLTLLISGNFAEIKSTVFKKYNKPNLFKITASDICERFKLALFLSLVLVLNQSQGMSFSQVYSYANMCGIVWCTEMLADWIKHSFITKFNFIPSSVYDEYALLLAGDVTGIGHEGVNLDHSHAVVKRIGLAQVPLVCVLARYLTEAARYLQFTTDMLWVVPTVWFCLLLLKYVLGKKLQQVSHAKLQNAPELSNTPAGGKKKKE